MKKKILYILVLLVVELIVNVKNVNALDCVSYNEGNGTESNPYVITTPEELYSIRCNLDSYFILGNDIDLAYDTTDENGLFYNEGRGWIPIGSFSGKLDGKNHEIVGMYQDYTLTTANNMSEEEVGLFGMIVDGGVIRNLKLTDVSINILENKNNGYNFYVGSLASYISIGNLENITTSGKIIYNNKDTSGSYGVHTIGGVVGRFRKGEINNVVNNINITYTGTQGYNIGGIIGDLTEEGAVYKSINNGNINSNGNDYGIVGGLIGSSAATSGDITISSCINNGKIHGAEVAGIVGETRSWENLNVNLINLANYGNIESYKYFAGGIVAIAFGYGSIEKSLNTGTITTNNGLVGGLAARSYIDIDNCYNIGKFVIKEDLNNTSYVGGIVGEFGSTDTNDITVSKSYSTNKIIFNGLFKNIGAIVGNNYGNIIDSYYYSEDSIKGVYDNVGSDNSIKLTNLEMKDKMKFSGFDFDNIWIIDTKNGYGFPQLRNNLLEGNFVENISIDNEETTILVGESLQMIFSISPNNDISKDVTWYVENRTGNAKITEDGKLYGLSVGTVIVKVVSNVFDIIYDEKEITIIENSLESIKLNKSLINLKVGTSNTLSVTYSPANPTDSKEIIWSSSDENIVTVDNKGNITAITTGTATITAASVHDSNIVAVCEVRVVDYLVGDMNQDEKITITDVIKLLRVYLRLEESNDNFLKIGDLNEDENITITDVIMLLRVYLNLE